MALISQAFNYIAIGLFVIFFFGFCVFIHELGHLLVALWRGLHVTSFSIGFGKRLCGFKYKGVDYKISMLPFGGYVELPQLETADEHFDAQGNKLPQVKPFDRLLTAFAGPFFNILFGLFLGTIIWIVGIDKPLPGNSVVVAGIIENSPESKAGLKVGDEIIKVNGKTFTNGYTDVFEKITLSTKGNITLTVIRNKKELDIVFVPEESRNAQMEKLWAPQFYSKGKVLIDTFTEKSPLHNSGILPGDEVKSINGKEIVSVLSFSQAVRNAPEGKVSIVVERDGKTLESIQVQAIKDNRKKVGLTLKQIDNLFIVDQVEAPANTTSIKSGFVITKVNGSNVDNSVWQNVIFGKNNSITLEGYYQENNEKAQYQLPCIALYGENSWMLGANLANKMPLVRQHPTPFSQFTNVINKTIATIKAVASRESKVKVRHMSGPLGIVRALGKTVSVGFLYGLELVVFISFSLALMNLLPLPVLDGGHIMLSTFEMVIRRKMPVSTMRIIETVFVVFLLSFMLYVTFYDVIRVTGIGQQAVEYWKI